MVGREDGVLGVAVVARGQGVRVSPSAVEAELLDGLAGDLKTIMRAVERGAADEAVELLRRRLDLATSLEKTEAEDDVLDQIDLLREAAEIASMGPLAKAAEDLALLVAVGQVDVAAGLIANAAEPIRKAMAAKALGADQEGPAEGEGVT